MPQPLGPYLSRPALAPLRRLLLSLRNTFLAAAAAVMDYSAAQPSSDDNSPPFDPTVPATPMAFPIASLDQLMSRSYFQSFHYPFNRANVPLAAAKKLPERGRLLACHDLAGNYSDDKWVQGGSNGEAYTFWHWYLIDIFVYFSHTLVTLPPPTWTNAAHKHGVKVLGTFIFEWDEGRKFCDELLSTKEYARSCADRLTELADSLGFDGWLLNIEVAVDIDKIPNLIEFISYLTRIMHSTVPGSLVIWYDAVTTNGDLSWQNQLNEFNKPFFDVCDGIFVNYTWRKDYPKKSANYAGDRKFDVYMGIDVFGRGTYGGGQWHTNDVLDVLKEDDVSAAIFAPGWVYETNQPPDFQTAQNRWWSLVEKSWGILQKYPKKLPFYSNFDQGHGYHFSVAGEQISDGPWCNISSQGFQPMLEFSDDPGPATIQVVVNFKEPSYSGGGNIAFKGSLEYGAAFTARLFKGELLLGDLPVHFIYSVKSHWSSMLGLLLEFSSTSEGRELIFIAPGQSTLPTISQFSSRIGKVIIPKVTKPEASPGWMTWKSSFALKGWVLTEIQAVCYNLASEAGDGSVNTSAQSPFDYYAVLGLIAIETQNFELPSSNSWLVEDHYVRWTPGHDHSKLLSVKISWKLKVGDSSSFSKYNIYVQKLSKQKVEDPRQMMEHEADEFLGVAHVEAFYISDLVVASGFSAIKFTIQACSVNGANQKLNASPSLLLDVEG